jgi:ABC-2 type transport system permease protein
MTAFSNHFQFEFKTGLRNPAAMLMNYLLPLGFYAAMGLVMVAINPGYKDLLLPSMIVFAIMSGNILGLPNPLVDAREAGIFRSFKINGVPAVSILSVPALSTMIHGLLTSIIIAVTAVPLFDAAKPENWLAIAVVTLLTAFTFSTLGMLIGVVSSSSRAVILWSQLIYLPSILLGGMMIPLKDMPESVRMISGLLPSTYSMEAFFGFGYQRETTIDPWLSMLVLLTSGILAFALAVYLFSWDSRNQTRKGSPLLALLVLLPYLAAILIVNVL